MESNWYKERLFAKGLLIILKPPPCFFFWKVKAPSYCKVELCKSIAASFFLAVILIKMWRVCSFIVIYRRKHIWAHQPNLFWTVRGEGLLIEKGIIWSSTVPTGLFDKYSQAILRYFYKWCQEDYALSKKPKTMTSDNSDSLCGWQICHWKWWK